MTAILARREAARFLEILRGGTSGYDQIASALGDELLDSGLTLEMVGTSKEELAALQVLGYKTIAAEHLGILRNGTSQYDRQERSLRAELAKSNGKLTLADLGTSEEELAKLRLLGCKMAAMGYLELLRRGSHHPGDHAKLLEIELGKGGLTLDGLGSSELEVASLI